MIPPGYPSGNQPLAMVVRKDSARVPPAVPKRVSSLACERFGCSYGLGQRKIDPVTTEHHLTNPTARPNPIPTLESAIEPFGDSSPGSYASSRVTASKGIAQTAVKLRYSQEFKGSYLKPLPPLIKVTADALDDTTWLDQFLSKEDQQWVDVVFVQENKAYRWVQRISSKLAPQKPLELVLKPNRNYKSILAQQIKYPVPKNSDYQWFDRSALHSPEQQVLSVYEGKRPAAALEFSSTLDPRIGSAELFPGLATRVLANPFGQGVTVIAEGRNNPQCKLYANRLEALVKKQWNQAEADIARGVPKDVALFHSHIRNLQKRGELELIKPDCLKREIIHAREQLSAYNLSVSSGQLTATQLAKRKLAIKKRITERFNEPGVTQQTLLAVSVRNRGFRTFPQHAGTVISRELRAYNMISNYEQQLAEEIPAGQEAAEQSAKRILTSCENLQHEFSKIIQTTPLASKETSYLNDKIRNLGNDQLLIFQVLDSPALTSIAGKISWQAAMEFKRVGYDLNDELTLPGRWTDRLLDPENPPRKLGSGYENTVYLLTYKIGNEKVMRVFKPEPAIDNSLWSLIITRELYHDQYHPNLTARNLATGEIARILGMDIMPDMSFCEHNHQIGLEMEFVSGKSAETTVPCPINPGKDIKLSTQELVMKQGNWKIKNKIFSGLADLELLDAICAQPDRHDANFFIDYKTGQVTGIDNDTCLYPFTDIIAPSANQVEFKRWRKGCRVGYPRLMTRKSYECLQKLDVEMLCESLPACFDLSIRSALKKRILLIREHSLALCCAGRIVDNWETWRDPITQITAIEFLSLLPFEFFARELKAHKEEESIIQPLLSKYHSNKPLSHQESNIISRYLWRKKLLHNDKINLRYAMSPSYYFTATYIKKEESDQT
ncbi:hypothetical protein [Endozoicomonas sp. ONNA2]|uniref:hypothetical protein n=1 Tax=Endozoicomonas sp. ONNA2 TaxID=2828741 RepID=UPI00214998A5|nr:hypothetical protein [Endozoicomonas sp. ONNA2]